MRQAQVALQLRLGPQVLQRQPLAPRHLEEPAQQKVVGQRPVQLQAVRPLLTSARLQEALQQVQLRRPADVLPQELRPGDALLPDRQAACWQWPEQEAV